eukprot:gnl/TRDRNA2_/TRDRNA2_130635_c2_seq1.p1 gnl/TRDRNA2_/TRDRNA2_130635_c2~~gnl/TRDRNA2_/TRDRNA2_130635_c2_seq1.p1  ORF type:complete len:165 (+),score=8.24 gnl/TRDRNA2_/TRDRNA2_130635_c2_seq1:2-496(+)
MGRHYCDICSACMCGYSEMTECGCYECICEGCLERVYENTECEYCEGSHRSCDRCEMVYKAESWLKCPVSNCPLKARLQDNCCQTCWDEFVADLGETGTAKVTSPVSGDLIKEISVSGTDVIEQVRTWMAKHLSLPRTSLTFMNKQQCILYRGTNSAQRKSPAL